MLELQNIDIAHDEATAKGIHSISFVACQLQEVQDNPYLCEVVCTQLKANHLLSPVGTQENSMPSLEESSPRRGRSSSRDSSMSTKRKRSSSPKRGAPMPQNHDSQHEKSKSQYQTHNSKDSQEEILKKAMDP